MTGEVLNLNELIVPDQLGCAISNKYREWNMARRSKLDEWKELRAYIYATSTRGTSNNKLPWSNSTVYPKLTQIRDNLFSNYIATMFPKRKWLNWEGSTVSDEDQGKVQAIKDYISWAVDQKSFKEEVRKLVLDYIDYGNCFATVSWVDESQEASQTDTIKTGFIGPKVVRISPLDIVMNPIAGSFSKTPKIIRSLVSIGEAREVIERMTTTPEQKIIANSVFTECMELRSRVSSYPSVDLQDFDAQYQIDGFDTFRRYLDSDYVELLTFAGDIYSRSDNTFYKNHMIVVMDRHKVVLKQEYPYPLAEIPVFHAGWRVRQDNLWAMGPLDNLVGMQYRLDHIENMKADIIDLTAYPVLKIKGTGAINDFTWGPLERIHLDSDGDVELLQPKVDCLQYNTELAVYEQRMEEMAGSPKEAMGFRTPGEKTAYEVQRLENAASRIFQNKISQFEEQVIEPLLNAMLVLAKENLNEQSVRVISSEYGVVSFRNITREDISANGVLKPIAARHFAEQAELIQNLTNFYASAIGSDPNIKQHFSTVEMSKVIEETLNLQDYGVVLPYVLVSEMAEQQKLMNAAQEGVLNEAQTPSGLTPDDYSEEMIDPSMAQEEPLSEAL